MQKLSLVVNNRYLDLFEDEDLNLQFGTNDIFNPESVIINYSKTFSIPSTKNNRIAFNFEENLNSENTLRRFNARLEIDNIIQYEGLLEITSITKTKGNIIYNCNFFTNELSFFESIETKGLDELDLSILEHSATTAFVQSSFSGTSDTHNVCYGMVDWGILSYSGSTGVLNRSGLANEYPNNGLFINYNLFPFPYAKVIFEKIFKENNWELISNFIDEDYFKRLLFVWKYGTPNFSLNSFSTNTKHTWLNLRGRLGTDISVGLPTQLRIKAYTSEEDLTGIIIATSTGFTTSLIFNYTIPSGYTYYITEVNYASGPGWVALQNNTPFNAEAYTVKNFGDTDLLELVDGNRIYLPDPTQSYSFEQSVVALPGPVYSAQLLDNNNRNIVYNYKKLLPNLEIYTQKDFILDIAKMFNLYFSFDFKTRRVFVEPRDSFYRNNIVDWSNKVDVSSDININYLQSGTFNFTLQDFESDYYTPLVNNIVNTPAIEPFTYNYTKIIDDSRNEVDFNLECGQTRFNLSGLPEFFRVSGSTGSIIFRQPYYFNANNITDNIQVIDSESVEPIIIEKPRFLFNNGLSNMTADTFINIGLYEDVLRQNTINRLPTLSPFSSVFNDGNQFALTFNNLKVVDGLNQEFNGLYRKFYSTLFDNSNRIKIITMRINLSSLDIYTLDPRDLIFININGEGGLYILNRIIDYNPNSNSLTEVELIKVIESSLPPSITNSNNFELEIPIGPGEELG